MQWTQTPAALVILNVKLHEPELAASLNKYLHGTDGMKKKAGIDRLLESDGWSGTVTRLTVMSLSLAGIYALPSAFVWYSENVLSKKVEIKGYEFALNVAFSIFGVVVLFEVINGIRLLRNSRRKRKEHA